MPASAISVEKDKYSDIAESDFTMILRGKLRSTT